MTATLVGTDLVVPVVPRFLRRWRIAAGLVLVFALVSGGLWWYQGGAFLRLTSAGVGTSTTVGRIVNVGFDLQTSGSGPVTIDRVTAPHIRGLKLQFVGVEAPAGEGVGLTFGDLRYVVPLVGRRVPSTAELGAGNRQFQIVMRVTARAPGDYAVRGVTVDFHSGLRGRTAVAEGSLLCLTATRPGQIDTRPSDPFLARCP